MFEFIDGAADGPSLRILPGKLFRIDKHAH